MPGQRLDQVLTLSQPMSFDFVQGAIENGCYEPEGVYLTAPFEGRRRVVQAWGARPEYYRRFVVGNKNLLGHNGVDFEMIPNERIVAVDSGIITTVGNDRERYGRFIRISHSWGESLYTRFQTFVVDAGQRVERGELIGFYSQQPEPGKQFHFGIRFVPYVIVDGWGGYSDPLPHFSPDSILIDFD